VNENVQKETTSPPSTKHVISLKKEVMTRNKGVYGIIEA